ncbi:MAG: phenylalanine--tRNA ligase subunit beta [Thermoplasmata archaeon]
MPVINFSYSDLCKLLEREVPIDTLRTRLPMIGADLNVADENVDEMSFEFFPDRPDLYSVEGIARALRSFLGDGGDQREYHADPSDVTIEVDSSVDDVRPFIWSAIVEDLTIDDPLIRSMMDLQEKLHLTLGRNRRKVAIGIHDMSSVESPFIYKAVLPDELSFQPLQGAREMTPREILSDHEKGKAYAFVLEGKERYPVIVDKNGTVLSMPPIINGIATEVTERTEAVLVDCTGTDINALKYAVNILVTALADRGGKIRTVTINQGGESFTAPDLAPREVDLDVAYTNGWLGTSLSGKDMAQCLAKVGYSVTNQGETLKVGIPPFRADILHSVDLAEDVAIGFGYERFGDTYPHEVTFGVEDPLVAFADRTRPVMIGLGFFEVATLSLSNPKEQFTAMNLPPDSEALRIRNPVTEAHTLVRTSLIPSLMTILRKNKHRELPQKIFEIGDVVRGTKNRKLLAGAVIHARAGFTEGKSVVLSIASGVGFSPDISAVDRPAFVGGRCAELRSDDSMIGLFGEVHPSTVDAFELKYPVVAFEIDLQRLRGVL